MQRQAVPLLISRMHHLLVQVWNMLHAKTQVLQLFAKYDGIVEHVEAREIWVRRIEDN